MENKADFVKLFLPVLQATDFCRDLENLEYKPEYAGNFVCETVVATFKNGSKKVAIVTRDSNFAMLKDIIKSLE